MAEPETKLRFIPLNCFLLRTGPGLLNAIEFPLLLASSGFSLLAVLCTDKGEILYDSGSVFNPPPFHPSLAKSQWSTCGGQGVVEGETSLLQAPLPVGINLMWPMLPLSESRGQL